MTKITIITKGSFNDKPISLHKVWGLTLLERCFLIVQKIGGEKIEIITDAKKEMEKFLSSKKIMPGISIKESSDERKGDIILYANYLYDHKLINNSSNIESAVYCRINSISELAEAKEALWERIKKPPTLKIFLKLINRPLGKQILKLFVNTRITPNQVSFISLAVGIVGAFCLTLDIYGYTILGAILIELAMCLDCVDGPLARLKNLKSDFGQWFDAVSDHIKIFAIYFCLTIGLFKHYGYYWIWAIAFLAQFGFFINIVMWLFSEHVVKDKKNNAYKLKSSTIKSFKNIIGKLFVFFTSMENFYAILLLGSIFSINLIVLVVFTVLMNMNIVYGILIKYFKNKHLSNVNGAT
jgi:phosphatidylglycerophosphate synthase